MVKMTKIKVDLFKLKRKKNLNIKRDWCKIRITFSFCYKAKVFLDYWIIGLHRKLSTKDFLCFHCDLENKDSMFRLYQVFDYSGNLL